MGKIYRLATYTRMELGSRIGRKSRDIEALKGKQEIDRWESQYRANPHYSNTIFTSLPIKYSIYFTGSHHKSHLPFIFINLTVLNQFGKRSFLAPHHGPQRTKIVLQSLGGRNRLCRRIERSCETNLVSISEDLDRRGKRYDIRLEKTKRHLLIYCTS